MKFFILFYFIFSSFSFSMESSSKLSEVPLIWRNESSSGQPVGASKPNEDKGGVPGKKKFSHESGKSASISINAQLNKHKTYLKNDHERLNSIDEQLKELSEKVRGLEKEFQKKTGSFETYLRPTVFKGADDSYSPHSSPRLLKAEYEGVLALKTEFQPFDSSWKLPQIVDQRAIFPQSSSVFDGGGNSCFSTSSLQSRYEDVSTAKPQSVRKNTAPLKVDTQHSKICCRDELIRNKIELGQVLAGEKAKIENAIHGSQTHLNELKEGLKSLETDMGQRKAKEAECSMQFGLLQENLSSFEYILHDINQKFDGEINGISKQKATHNDVQMQLKEYLDEFQQNIDKKIEGKLLELCTEVAKLSDIEGSLKDLQNAHQAFNKKFKTLPRRLDGLQEQCTRIQIRVDQIETQQSRSVIGQMLSFFCVWRSVPGNTKQKNKSQ